MRYVSVFFILFSAVILSFGQNSFYQTDSVVYYGSVIIDNGLIENAIRCEIKQKTNNLIYSPDEVLGYGFSDGRVYVSKQIQIGDSIKRVFLLRLVEDKTTLYVYYGKAHKVFYIEKDSASVIELLKYNKENKEVVFRKELSKITADCQSISNAIKLVTYKVKPLSKLIENYNNCSAEPFPFLKYGLILGCGVRSIEIKGNKLAEYKDFVNNRYKGSILPGFFIDCPIEMSNFSFHTEMYLSRYRYSFSSTSTSNILDLVANTSSIHLPVLLRYTLPEMTIRPFVNGGLNVVYNMQNSTVLYNTLITPDYIELKSIDRTSYISKFQFGFSVGAGIEYKLNYRQSVFIEFRCNKQLSSSNKYTFNNTQLELLTGLNI